ncbi:hypothetical protein LXL04_033210 [Taraxacum kok-saghyz]
MEVPKDQMSTLLDCGLYNSTQMLLDSKHEAANAYVDAGHCYKKTNSTGEIAELYEQEQNMEKSMVFYDKAGDLYQGEEVSSSANQCRLKIA